MKNKQCPKCKTEKPLTLKFWGIHRKRKDGFQFYCRKCKKLDDRIYSRKYREENPEWKKEDNHNNLSIQAKLIKEYYKKYPERLKVNQLVGYLIRKGKINRKPCQICENIKSHGHHEDYNKPLDIIWLCAKHHKAIHNPLEDFKVENN